MKICPKCKLNKTAPSFARNKSSLDGLQTACRACNNAYAAARYRTSADERSRALKTAQAWAKAHPVKNASSGFRKELKHKYGMTVEQFHALIGEQNGLCKICSMTNDGIRLFIDHDHGTGKVRGLLCNKCNIAIGALRENPELFARALTYLKEAA